MIPTVTVDQMREVDRLMVEDFGITLLQMMENAGRCLAEQARRMLGGDVAARRIVVLAGRGGNGGGGLAAARRLSIWGADVAVTLGSSADTMEAAANHQLATLRRMGVSIGAPDEATPDFLDRADVVLDALIGYGLRGAPREPTAGLIWSANAADRPILALDTPSGLHGDSGLAHEPTIRASATLTLALPKVGLLHEAAREWTGDIYLADISVPSAVYQRLGIDVAPLFSRGDIVRVGSSG